MFKDLKNSHGWAMMRKINKDKSHEKYGDIIIKLEDDMEKIEDKIRYHQEMIDYYFFNNSVSAKMARFTGRDRKMIEKEKQEIARCEIMLFYAWQFLNILTHSRDGLQINDSVKFHDTFF